jgi:hypothetical protein
MLQDRILLHTTFLRDEFSPLKEETEEFETG